jgi:hypothetical protein
VGEVLPGVEGLRAGLVQSLLIKAQRQQLDEIGRAVGTPVVYLKAAWADPVLFGGRGERTGGDIDVLVRPDRFEAFAQALTERGFRRHLHPSASYERYFGHKEWTFGPPPGALAIDLHRDLTEPIWYHMRTDELLDRAIAWDSVDGPILSLDAEDQVLYAAAHYSNHFYDLDPRHLDDIDRLVRSHPVDWDQVWSRGHRASLTLPVALLVDALVARGCAVGAAGVGVRPLPLRVRRRLAELWVSTTPQLARKGLRSRGVDYLLLRPLLSDEWLALPKVVLEFGLPWVKERLLRKRTRANGAPVARAAPASDDDRTRSDEAPH